MQGKELIINTMAQYGIQTLRSSMVFPTGDSSIQLVGVGDYYDKPEFQPAQAFSETDPRDDHKTTRILMSHNPDSTPRFKDYKVDLQVSGHTHGGQICYPNGTPILKTFHYIANLHPWIRKIVPRQAFTINKWEYASGFHKVARTNPSDPPNQLYVSRGIATHPPFRLFCPPELTVITMEPDVQ